MAKANQDSLVQFNAARSEQAVAQQYMAIVSPCSECKNFNTDTTSGSPSCPRRVWIEQQKAAEAGNQDVDTPPSYLTSTGTDADTFANPVYDKANQTVVIWIAALENNRALYDENGQLLTTDILAPGFDTKYARCESLPVIPAEHQAAHWSGGVYKEKDQVLVTTMKVFQEQYDPTNPFQQPQVLVGGFAKKVNFAFGFTLLVPRTDQLATGI